MSILKSIVNVNNGNTGWTASNVIDALETVFSNLGFHGGSAVTGVPCGLINPNNLVSTDNNDWRQAGGPGVFSSHETYYYDVVAQGTTAYRWLKRYTNSSNFSWSHAYSENESSRPNQIRIDGHGLVQNQAIHWAPGETDENKNISGLTLDTVYYVIVVDNQYIKLATDATNAANGTNITLTHGGYSSNYYAAKSNSISYFRQESLSIYDNLTLAINTGDILNINLISTGAGNFHFCYDTDSYDASNYVVEGLSGNDSVDANPTGTGSDSGNVIWDTYGYVQTYTAVTQPTFHPTETYQEPGRRYIYANDTNSSMKGTIIINPKVNSRNYGPDPFWDYEVPQSGSRSALKIRVWRHQPSSSSYKGKIRGMKILNQGSGWTAGEAFTIPGDQIGGATPADDITFGTRATGDTDLGNGTPEIAVTNLGGGSSFFQKADNGQWAVLKNINDASKTYGTTYYAFGVDTNTNNTLHINSGSGWNWFNRPGTRETSGTTNGGFFTGYTGLDRQNTYNCALTNSDNGYYTFESITYCTSATPTAYPLQIRVYRAQSPQDTNFAIIQFCQIIDTEVQTFGTFTIYRGSAFGANIWDLDYVYNGSFMTYETSTREIILRHRVVGWYYSYYGAYGEAEEPPEDHSIAREAFWGYVRQPSGVLNYIDSSYKCNIETTTDNTDLILYYRNSTYDQYNGNGVDSGANYYRPIKGLPLSEKMVPCPYYLPDDFVMLQVSTSPGLTQFRTGDTVTIGGNENYEIIRASYQTQQNGLDGIDNNSTMGMLFLGRIN